MRWGKAQWTQVGGEKQGDEWLRGWKFSLRSPFNLPMLMLGKQLDMGAFVELNPLFIILLDGEPIPTKATENGFKSRAMSECLVLSLLISLWSIFPKGRFPSLTS